jgi:excisionase family DNA binding protein
VATIAQNSEPTEVQRPEPLSNNSSEIQAASQARQAGLEPTTLGLEGGEPSRPAVFKPSQPVTSSLSAETPSVQAFTLDTRISHAKWCKGGAAGSANLRSVHGGADDLLTVREVASRLGLSTATVYTLCHQGELPHFRISNAIRIAPADVEAFLSRKREGGR